VQRFKLKLAAVKSAIRSFEGLSEPGVKRIQNWKQWVKNETPQEMEITKNFITLWLNRRRLKAPANVGR